MWPGLYLLLWPSSPHAPRPGSSCVSAVPSPLGPFKSSRSPRQANTGSRNHTYCTETKARNFCIHCKLAIPPWLMLPYVRTSVRIGEIRHWLVSYVIKT